MGCAPPTGGQPPTNTRLHPRDLFCDPPTSTSALLIRFDVAFSPLSHQTAVAAIACSPDDRVVEGSGIRRVEALTPFAIKIEAMRLGLLLAQRLHRAKVSPFSDAQTAVDVVNESLDQSP